VSARAVESLQYLSHRSPHVITRPSGTADSEALERAAMVFP